MVFTYKIHRQFIYRYQHFWRYHMSLIYFPKVGKYKTLAESNAQDMIDGVISLLGEDNQSEIFEPNLIDVDLFKDYLQKFPCFQLYEGVIDPVMIYQAYISNCQLSEKQEIAFLCVLELLSDYEFGFALADVFEIWKKDDQVAFLRVLALHSSRQKS